VNSTAAAVPQNHTGVVAKAKTTKKKTKKKKSDATSKKSDSTSKNDPAVKQ
jgi:hypothetical protein